MVWVARRIPDGYVSAHANQARITTFPKDDPENCLYSPDVVAFAREMGYYDGTDEDFSFCEAYAPADFGALRGCEARVWAFFRTVADGMDKYVDYAMGHNAENRMPLWVKPRTKVSPKVVFDCMRDHYEGTPMDMTTDIGAGGSACPYRWRPMYFEVDGVEYCNERATATQQTGFWFVAQARPDVPDNMGILWFGVDDAATSCLTPIYCCTQGVPECLSEGNGSMLEYSPTSAFWLFNRVSNFAYMRYDMIAGDIRKVVDKWENERAPPGARRRCRGHDALAQGPRQIPLGVQHRHGAAVVRPLVEARQVPAGEIYGRQRQKRTCGRAGTTSTARAARRISWTTATANRSPTRSSSRVTARSGNVPWPKTTEKYSK
ncbi:MAG: C69 family dipeptidase [Alistipes shahii]